MSAEDTAGKEATRIGPGTGSRALARAGFPVLGAALGWLLDAAAGWVAGLPWAPLQGLFRLVASLPEPQATIGAALLGLLAGVLLALLAEHDYVHAAVGPARTVLTRGGRNHILHRADVSAVFPDGTHLVALGRRTEELLRLKGDFDTGAFAAAFRAHGYPWQDTDPHAAEYRRWVAGLPGLDAGAHALLKARAHALEKSRADDAAQLREELAALGIVVREEKKQQFFRRDRGLPAAEPET
ncbi:YqeB family protein [Streptomyces sp. CA-132043]|uniref:YqeB family protein n=1 Tax=Streptomyces sp. CA-132043 TaxID=3240048 RepID=UPI003D8CA221